MIEIPVLCFNFGPAIRDPSANPPNGLTRMVSKWCERAILSEKSQLPASVDVAWCEGHIVSDDPELFTINGIIYDKIFIVLGEETVYWMFHTIRRPCICISGKKKMRISSSLFHFPGQYNRVLQQVKNEIEERE